MLARIVSRYQQMPDRVAPIRRLFRVGRAARFAAACVLAAAWLVAAPTPVHACLCMGTGNRWLAVAQADAVFSGTLVDWRDTRPVTRTPGGAKPGSGTEGTIVSVGPGVIRFTFAVDGVAKGLLGSRVDVVQGGSMCDFGFQRGERYLVFAHRGPEGLATSKCAATGALGEHPWASQLPLRPPAVQWLLTIEWAAAGAVALLAAWTRYAPRAHRRVQTTPRTQVPAR